MFKIISFRMFNLNKVMCFLKKKTLDMLNDLYEQVNLSRYPFFNDRIIKLDRIAIKTATPEDVAVDPLYRLV